MIRPRFRVNSVNSVFFENEKTDSLPSQSVFTHPNKKKTIFFLQKSEQQKKPFFFLQKSEQQKNHFFYRNLSNKKKPFFFLQKSKISLQKYQKYVFTHHNKIKNHFFFQKSEIFVQTGENEVEQLSSRTGAGEAGRTEGELREKRRPPTPWSRYVSLLFFFFLFFLSFFLFIFSVFALSPIENTEKGFGFSF